MLGLLETGSGFWSAIIWILLVLVIGSIVIYIRNKVKIVIKKIPNRTNLLFPVIPKKVKRVPI